MIYFKPKIKNIFLKLVKELKLNFIYTLLIITYEQ